MLTVVIRFEGIKPDKLVINGKDQSDLIEKFKDVIKTSGKVVSHHLEGHCRDVQTSVTITKGTIFNGKYKSVMTLKDKRGEWRR